MPASPELGYGRRDIGIVEVFGTVKAKHGGKADSHVAVAGEVKINLQRVGCGSQPRQTEVERTGGKRRVRNLPYQRGDKQLLRQSHNQPPQSPRRTLGRVCALAQLTLKVAEAGYGSRSELREKRNIQQNVKKRARGRLRIFAAVRDIGYFSEREKRYAHRQDKSRGEVLDAEKTRDAADKKVKLLEIEQHQQVNDFGIDEFRLFPPAAGYQHTGSVVHRRG